MGKHTKTPWSYRQAKQPTDGEYDFGISAEINGTQRCIAEAFGRVSETDRLDAEANAAFIVRACNNFDALVEALNTLEAALRKDSRDKTVFSDTVEYHLDGNAMYAAINKVRAALAKAREGE